MGITQWCTPSNTHDGPTKVDPHASQREGYITTVYLLHKLESRRQIFCNALNLEQSARKKPGFEVNLITIQYRSRNPTANVYP